MRSESLFSWKRTCRRTYSLIIKSLKLKYCSRSSVNKCLQKNMLPISKRRPGKDSIEGKTWKTAGYHNWNFDTEPLLENPEILRTTPSKNTPHGVGAHVSAFQATSLRNMLFYFQVSEAFSRWNFQKRLHFFVFF